MRKAFLVFRIKKFVVVFQHDWEDMKMERKGEEAVHQEQTKPSDNTSDVIKEKQKKMW